MPDFRRTKDYAAGWQWKELSTSSVPPWVNYLYPLAIVGIVVLLVAAYLRDGSPGVRSAGEGPAATPTTEDTVGVVDATRGTTVAVPAEAVRVIRAGVLAIFTGDSSVVPVGYGETVPPPALPHPAATLVSEELLSIGPTSVVLSVVVAPAGVSGSEPLRSVSGRAELADGFWRFTP